MKERTIGAVVLVAFAVLVVPVFLDGSVEPPRQTVSAPVTLPGQSEQPRKQQTIVLKRDREEPVPAALPEVVTEQPEPEPAIVEQPAETVASAAKDLPLANGGAAPPPQKVEAESEPAAASKLNAEREAAASSTGMWAVQLGSFSNRANAERLAADLRDEGYAAFLSEHGTTSGELHRVRIGPQKNRDAAESVAAKLNDVGHKGQVVPHP